MRRFCVPTVSLIAMLFGMAALSQEADAPEEAVEPVSEATTAAAGGDEQSGDESDAESDALEEFDDSDLDLQTYEQDDDDFVPTEEIPADEAIPFPSDI